MKAMIVSSPAPACILSVTDPARAHVPASETDVAKTWEIHRPIQYGDDYDLTEQTAHLDMIGEFK